MTTDRAVLSIDFEFFTHTPAYRAATGSTQEEAVGLKGIEFLLDVLNDTNASASFFVVSEIAKTHPEVLRDLALENHEIGSHGRKHKQLTSLDPEARRREIAGSKSELQDATGEAISGFRAPVFALSNGHFTMLQEAGYDYDSSIVPSRSIPGFYGGEHREQRPGKANTFTADSPESLLELPVSVMPGLRTPLSGAWLRFFGFHYTAYGMRALSKLGITPVLYVHPWELVELPSVTGVPRRVYWRTGKWMRATIRRLLEEPFEFVTASTEIEKYC